jgi:hypothetical protein
MELLFGPPQTTLGDAEWMPPGFFIFAVRKRADWECNRARLRADGESLSLLWHWLGKSREELLRR